MSAAKRKRKRRLQAQRKRMKTLHDRREHDGQCPECGCACDTTAARCSACLEIDRNRKRVRLKLRPWVPGGPGRPRAESAA